MPVLGITVICRMWGGTNTMPPPNEKQSGGAPHRLIPDSAVGTAIFWMKDFHSPDFIGAVKKSIYLLHPTGEPMIAGYLFSSKASSSTRAPHSQPQLRIRG
jgi:hypothetical protein